MIKPRPLRMAQEMIMRFSLIDGLAVLREVHEKKRNGSGNNGCNGGDAHDFTVDILHDFGRLRPHIRTASANVTRCETSDGQHGHHENIRKDHAEDLTDVSIRLFGDGK